MIDAEAEVLPPEGARFMDRARELAGRGWGGVHPNPLVGCVIVREGRIVGEGWHEVLGGPHAEVNALRDAGEAAHGADVYVSLEPCNHEGRTPPCTDALLRAGVRRITFGAQDPGSISGGGGARLCAEGVEVRGPVLDPEESRRDNPAFFHTVGTERCYTVLKLALSLDGKIAAAPGVRTVISGSPAHEEVHRLRAGFDAIVVGGATARVDDPLLTARGAVRPRVPPRRVVLDPGGRLDPGARMVREEGGEVVVFASRSVDPARVRALVDAGVRTETVAAASGGGLDLDQVFARLWSLGARSALCEGGGRLASALLRANLVQRLYLFVSPLFLGEGGIPGFPGAPSMTEGWMLTEEPRRIGPDTLLVLDRRD